MATEKMIKGKIGEDAVANHMKNKGYVLLDRNFNCQKGELDLVMELDDELAIIEVKARSSNKFGTPFDSVTNLKQSKIKAATEFYIYINQLYNKNIVFYVAGVLLDQYNRVTSIDIIRNAFE